MPSSPMIIEEELAEDGILMEEEDGEFVDDEDDDVEEDVPSLVAQSVEREEDIGLCKEEEREEEEFDIDDDELGLSARTIEINRRAASFGKSLKKQVHYSGSPLRSEPNSDSET